MQWLNSLTQDFDLQNDDHAQIPSSENSEENDKEKSVSAQLEIDPSLDSSPDNQEQPIIQEDNDQPQQPDQDDPSLQILPKYLTQKEAIQRFNFMANKYLKIIEGLEEKEGEGNYDHSRLNLGEELVKFLEFYDLGIGPSILSVFKKIWKDYSEKNLTDLLKVYKENNREWMVKKGYKDPLNVKQKPFSIRTTNLLGFDLNGVQKHRDKRRRVESELTPMEKLAKLLQNPQLHSLRDQIASQSSNSKPSTPSPQNPYQMATGQQLRALTNEITKLKAQVEKNSSIIPSKNPHEEPVGLSLEEPERGINCLTVDYQKQTALTKRIREIACGKSIDPNIRNVVRAMNAATNRELVRNLEGTYHHIQTC